MNRNSLPSIFNPVFTHPTMAKHIADKNERRSIKLAAFGNHIVHITGEENVYADSLSR